MRAGRSAWPTAVAKRGKRAADEAPAASARRKRTIAPAISPEDHGDRRKLGQRIAGQIESDIRRNGWPVGEILGSEAQLIERFGVSRAALREAVRILESHHVARMRRGPNGGLIVTAPDMAAVQASAALFLDYARVSQDDLFEVRSALELACIRQVVERLDETIIERLRSAVATEASQLAEFGISASLPDLHVLIAEASGNPALWLFVDVLTRLTQQGASRNVPNTAGLADELHRTHAGIVDAIIEGDVGLAQHRMSRHLRSVASYYR
jgi:DNA-binding FadR family transcriptional regulator